MDGAFWADILRYIIPAAFVLGAVYMMLKNYTQNEDRKRFYEARAANHRVSMPIRLQAYERLALLLERLSVNNLILRVRKSGMSANDLQQALVTEIRAEFDHNLSQQIYVSSEAWLMIVNARENLVKTIHIAYSALPPDATSMDLSKVIFDIVMKEDVPATYKALEFVKTEARDLF
jgi:hypothetical protein